MPLGHRTSTTFRQNHRICAAVAASLGVLLASAPSAADSVSGRFRGVQVAFAIHNEGDAQLGAGNTTERGKGLRVGLCNRATSMKGLQLGLFNFKENGFLPFFPFPNFAF